MIAALDENNLIGSDGGLPWHYPEDLEHFNSTVKDTVTISGRKTFGSADYAKFGRFDIVLTSDESLESPSDSVVFVNSKEEAIQVASDLSDKDETIYIIGGGQIYEMFLDTCDEMILTHIHKEYNGDAYFPEFDVDDWNVETIDTYDEFTIKNYQRK